VSSPTTFLDIDYLTPGQHYYIRYRNCLSSGTDSICSDFGYIGYPSAPASSVASQVPNAPGLGFVSVLDNSSVIVDWNRPLLRSEGLNGSPLTEYHLSVSAPRGVIYSLTISDSTKSFSGNMVLTEGSSFTRCIPLSSSSYELELYLQELYAYDGIKVSSVELTDVSRKFLVTFPSIYGNLPTLQKTNVSCSDEFYSLVSLVKVQSGSQKYVSDVVKIVTSSTSSVSGYYDLRYGFKGNFEKVVGNIGLTDVITGTISQGARAMVTSDDSSHLIAPGVTFRIGDEELCVETISGVDITFSPYKTISVSSENIFVQETLLGIGQYDSLVPNQISTFQDLSAEVITGDLLMLVESIDGSCSVGAKYVVEVASITSSSISFNSFSTSASNIIIYRQKNAMVPHDIQQKELRSALQAHPEIGLVDVTRTGPTQFNGYTWSVTFSSTMESTFECPSGSSCLQASKFLVLQLKSLAFLLRN